MNWAILNSSQTLVVEIHATASLSLLSMASNSWRGCYSYRKLSKVTKSSSMCNFILGAGFSLPECNL